MVPSRFNQKGPRNSAVDALSRFTTRRKPLLYIYPPGTNSFSSICFPQIYDSCQPHKMYKWLSKIRCINVFFLINRVVSSNILRSLQYVPTKKIHAISFAYQVKRIGMGTLFSGRIEKKFSFSCQKQIKSCLT